MNKLQYAYVASPYSHKSKSVMNIRYHRVLRYTAHLLNTGIFVYSPIVHCHDMAKKHAMPTDFAFWKHYNECMLSHSNGMLVLGLKGVKDSIGVKGELEIAAQYSIPVKFVDPISYNESTEWFIKEPDCA
jgi:hypothetical protein